MFLSILTVLLTVAGIITILGFLMFGIATIFTASDIFGFLIGGLLTVLGLAGALFALALFFGEVNLKSTPLLEDGCYRVTHTKQLVGKTSQIVNVYTKTEGSC